jgi:hypothetical protein
MPFSFGPRSKWSILAAYPVVYGCYILLILELIFHLYYNITQMIDGEGVTPNQDYKVYLMQLLQSFKMYMISFTVLNFSSRAALDLNRGLLVFTLAFISLNLSQWVSALRLEKMVREGKYLAVYSQKLWTHKGSGDRSMPLDTGNTFGYILTHVCVITYSVIICCCVVLVFDGLRKKTTLKTSVKDTSEEVLKREVTESTYSSS